jgi:hypothetical protein
VALGRENAIPRTRVLQAGRRANARLCSYDSTLSSFWVSASCRLSTISTDPLSTLGYVLFADNVVIAYLKQAVFRTVNSLEFEAPLLMAPRRREQWRLLAIS